MLDATHVATDDPAGDKAGRMLSASNMTEIADAMKKLQTVLKKAGMDPSKSLLAMKALHGCGEKCDMCAMPMMDSDWRPFGGATTFADLDAWRDAADREADLSNLTYQFDTLVDNIMEDDDLAIIDKASAITALAQELEARVGPTAADDPSMDDMDMGVASRGAGIVKRALRSLLGGGGEPVDPELADEKATWDTAYVNNLPDSAFAVVLPGGTKEQGVTTPKSLRKLPHHKADGSVDLPHLRNALAREPQSNMSAAAHATASAHLARHAKAEGIGEPAAKEFDVAVAPGSIVIFRDKNQPDRWRYLAIATNKFEDKEGEIFSSSAHREYVDWANRTKTFPELWAWHTKGTRMGVADAITFDEDSGFRVSTGLFDAGMEGAAEALAGMSGLAMSHGYVYPSKDLVDGVYNRYRSFEESVLPSAEIAANVGTAFAPVKEDPMFKDGQREFFVNLFGAEKVSQIEGGLAEWSKEFEDAGVRFKALFDGADAPAATAAAAKDADADAAAAAAAPAVGDGGAAAAAAAAPAGDAPAGDAPAAVAPPADDNAELIKALKTVTDPIATALGEFGEWRKEVDQKLGVLAKTREDSLADLIMPRGLPPSAFVGASGDDATVAKGKDGKDAKTIVDGADGDGSDLPPELAAAAPYSSMLMRAASSGRMVASN